MSCILPVLGLQCFENLKIIPFLAMSTRKYWEVVLDHQEEACSAHDTHSWLRNNYQQENQEDALQWAIKVSKAQSIWEQAPKKCAVMVMKLLSFFLSQTQNQRYICVNPRWSLSTRFLLWMKDVLLQWAHLPSPVFLWYFKHVTSSSFFEPE